MNKCNSWTEYENKLNEIKKTVTEHRDVRYLGRIGLCEQEAAEISSVLLDNLPTVIEHNNFEALRLIGNILDILIEYVDLEDLAIE